jgi:[ribosomal protein S18]-alanine N-acetyltransferase
MLLEDFLVRARNHGVSRVHLEVREGNSAIGLYRDAGFSPVGRRRNYYHATDGRRFDAVTLACQL